MVVHVLSKLRMAHPWTMDMAKVKNLRRKQTNFGFPLISYELKLLKYKYSGNLRIYEIILRITFYIVGFRIRALYLQILAGGARGYESLVTYRIRLSNFLEILDSITYAYNRIQTGFLKSIAESRLCDRK